MKARAVVRNSEVKRIKVRRNNPCPCGSGRKYKRCCLSKERSQTSTSVTSQRLLPRPSPAEFETVAVQNSDRPIIEAKFKGYRFRAVLNRLHVRPLAETFHEFLWKLLKWTLEKEWYFAQLGKPEAERHQAVQWFGDLYEWQKANTTPENRALSRWGALPSGDVQALTALAYDVYTLLHSNALPDRLLARLRDRHEFQGARYEIAVAAIYVRAGFELAFLEAKGAKHCEFIATHKRTGCRVGVEAKSRRRAGVLHEKGTMDTEAVLRGDVQGLFDQALQQKPEGMPFIVFIDLNSTPQAGRSPVSKPWWDGLSGCFETHDAIKAGKEDRTDSFNAVIVTNFSTHYFGEQSASVTGEKLIFKFLRPSDPFPDAILAEVWDAVNRYGAFPVDPEAIESVRASMAASAGGRDTPHL